MDCYSSYFTYKMVCVCGIPSITVRGSLNDWRNIRAPELGAERGVSPRSFPSGLASVPVKLVFPKNPALDRDLDQVGGFLGVEQEPVDLALSPVISWSV